MTLSDVNKTANADSALPRVIFVVRSTAPCCMVQYCDHAGWLFQSVFSEPLPLTASRSQLTFALHDEVPSVSQSADRSRCHGKYLSVVFADLSQWLST